MSAYQNRIAPSFRWMVSKDSRPYFFCIGYFSINQIQKRSLTKSDGIF